MKTLSEQLKALRLSAGLSQSALAKKIGISRETVVAIECDIKKSNAVKALPITRVGLWVKHCRNKDNGHIIESIHKCVTKIVLG